MHCVALWCNYSLVRGRDCTRAHIHTHARSLSLSLSLWLWLALSLSISHVAHSPSGFFTFASPPAKNTGDASLIQVYYDSLLFQVCTCGCVCTHVFVCVCMHPEYTRKHATVGGVAHNLPDIQRERVCVCVRARNRVHERVSSYIHERESNHMWAALHTTCQIYRESVCVYVRARTIAFTNEWVVTSTSEWAITCGRRCTQLARYTCVQGGEDS